jgi:hypothetical protein
LPSGALIEGNRLIEVHSACGRDMLDECDLSISTERLIEAWNRITAGTIESAWEILDPWRAAGEPADDEGYELDNDQFRLMGLHV